LRLGADRRRQRRGTGERGALQDAAAVHLDPIPTLGHLFLPELAYAALSIAVPGTIGEIQRRSICPAVAWTFPGRAGKIAPAFNACGGPAHADPLLQSRRLLDGLASDAR